MSEQATSIAILIVDDQALLREGFRRLLEMEPGFVIVGSVKDGLEAVQIIEHLTEQGTAPDIVLMDVRMPHMNGIQATQQIRQRWPQVHIVMLTTFDDEEYIVAGLRAGAHGYLLKDVTSLELVTAIRAAYRGEMPIQPAVTAKLIAHVRNTEQPNRTVIEVKQNSNPHNEGDGLTEREHEVLIHLGRGASNREIGETLFITEGTVKNHVSNILSKLGLRDRTQAALYAREHGFI